MNSCESFQGLISEGLDDALTDEQHRELEAHLLQCATCREFKQSAENLRELISSLPLQSMSSPLRASASWWRRTIALPLPAIAAGTLLVIASWLVHLIPSQSGEAESRIEQFFVSEQVEVIQLEPVSAVKLVINRESGL